MPFGRPITAVIRTTPVLLIVEDDALVRELTVDIVELAGYVTVTASNAMMR